MNRLIFLKGFLLLCVFGLSDCHSPTEISCKNTGNIIEFPSYLDTISIKKIKPGENSNLKLQVFAKYQLNDSIYISPLKDAILSIEPSTYTYNLLTNSEGIIQVKIKPNKIKYSIGYFGYHSYSDTLSIEPGKFYNLKIILGKDF